MSDMVEVTGPQDRERSYVSTGDPTSPWADEDHAWHAGLLLGAFMRIGLPCTPVMAGPDYTADMDITLPEIPTKDGQPLVVRIRVLSVGAS